MTAPRQPMAFRIDPPAEKPRARPAATTPRPARKLPPATVTPSEIDVFATEMEAAVPAAPPVQRRRGLATVFLGAVGALLSLAFGLWIDGLVRDLFARSDWLGWTALALVGIAAAAFLAIVAREAASLIRLSSVVRLQELSTRARAEDDMVLGRRATAELSALVADRAETAAGRRLVAAQSGEIVDGADLVDLAEREILAPLDAEAKALVTGASRRVAAVTAISPRAMVDVAYVLYEAARLVSRISAVYGGRPGTLGFLRLFRSVFAHLAVTGTIAAGDALIQQLVGHGLAARISARLGEGVVNGMMTARIGLAAMEAARPFPFVAVKRPGLGEVVSSLSDLAPGRDAVDKQSAG